MDFRKSFSKPFKKLKDGFPRGSRKRDGRSEGGDSRKGSKVDVIGGEASQSNSDLHPEVTVGTVESGPSREGTNVDGKKTALVDADPPTPAPAISHIGEPDGMCITSFSVLPLIGLTDDVGSPAIPNRVHVALSSSQDEPNVTDENRFELWKSTASASAKLLLRAAKESADAFPPLKSAVGGLCFILDSYEVWCPFSIHYQQYS